MNPTLVIQSRAQADLEIPLGEAGTQAGGVGGWAKIGRPRRKAITTWDGEDGFELSVPVIFDGLVENQSVERQIARLERLAQRGEGDRHPPVLTLRGPVPHTGLEWVINDISWGPLDRRGDGQRIRQHATIVFWEYVDPDLTVQRRQKSPAKDAQERNKDKGGSPRTYAVKKGDTLSSIAARKLGNANRWRDIADLNNIRDPRNIKIGQVIRLPRE